MSIGIALGGFTSGLSAGSALGNGIMDRKHRAEREVVADQRYKDKIDRQAGLDARNSTLQDAQELRSQSAFDMNKQQHEFTRQVRDAGNLIDAYKSNGNKALAGMIKNTEKGQQMMQAGGFDDVEFQHTTGEDGTKTWYVLGKQKGSDIWGLINQGGQMAGDNDQPMALDARGLYALGMHTMDISEEAANAAVAAAGKTQDTKRATYATGRRKQADVMAKQGLINKGKLTVAGLNNKGKLDVANVKNSKSSKFTTATSKQDIANMTQLLTSLGTDSSLIPIAAPRASIVYKNALRETGDEAKAADAVKQFMSEHVTTKPGTVYGTNPSFSAEPLTPKGTLANGEKDMSALFMGKTKEAPKQSPKKIASKTPVKSVGLSSIPKLAIKKGVSVGVFKQNIENIRNSTKGYNDSVALARKIRSGEGAFKDFSDKQKADLLYYSEHRRLPGKGDK